MKKCYYNLEEKNYIYVQPKFNTKTKEKTTPIIHVIPLDKNDESRPYQHILF